MIPVDSWKNISYWVLLRLKKNQINLKFRKVIAACVEGILVGVE